MRPGTKHTNYTRLRPTNKPDDLVKAVGVAYRKGMPLLVIAKRYGVSRPAIRRWVAAYKWERPAPE